MYNIGIIGASGYTGYELIKRLTKHNSVQLVVLNSETYAGQKVNKLYKDFSGDNIFTNYSIEEIKSMNVDVVFLAVPNGTAMKLAPELLNANIKVIDLSADYRFKDPEVYEKVYNIKHCDKENDKESGKVQHNDKERKAVYGLPELFRNKIKKAELIANPGCYATGMTLSTYPIQKLAKYIVFDCKSGWSGAGKSSVYAKDPNTIKDNIIAYNLTTHRHKYEISQFIKTKLSFTPHVIDTFQGMMITAHVLLKKNYDAAEIKEKIKSFYKESSFVEVVDDIPDIHKVQGTNKCIIGGFEIDENNQLVIVTVLDNLVKGASGQAVQNMNIILGIDEKEGLI
ncbi:N-acetyl-gamma-glutamyl-phosphate reductase [Candidatus Woesearchaeota archaeon]|nr:N-acetyl-gamma-glutamyl-phosphate reductase [Candidatus Woesearchaeota archaeon]